MGTFLKFLKKQPLVTAAIAIVVAMAVIKLIPCREFLQLGIVRMVLCFAMLFFLYLISGEKSMGTSEANNTGTTWYVIKASLGFWILAVIAGVVAFLGTIEEFTKGWLINLITLFFMMLFSGLFEELAFRAVLNDAVIYQFRSSKHVFLISAVVTSLVFGAAHVIGSDLSTMSAIGQAAMKTLFTGIIGLAFLLLYWKTRNIWACGLVHGIYDFLASFSRAFSGNTMEVNYVTADMEIGMSFIVTYTVFILIVLIITLFIWKKIRKDIDFEKIRETW